MNERNPGIARIQQYWTEIILTYILLEFDARQHTSEFRVVFGHDLLDLPRGCVIEIVRSHADRSYGVFAGS